MLGAPLLPGQHRGTSLLVPAFSWPSVWHITPAWAAEPLQKTPTSYQGWERKDPLGSGFRTTTKLGQDTGIPGGWQAMAVLLRGSRVRHCLPRMPLPPGTGSSPQLAGGRQAQRGEAGGTCLGFTLQTSLFLAPNKAQTSSRSRRWNYQSRGQ